MKQALKIIAISGLMLAAEWIAAQRPGAAAPGESVWAASWGASQQVPEPQNELLVDDLRDATVRQIVHLSAGGSAVRVHLTNAFGTEALHFTSVHIARPLSPASAAIDPASDRALMFAGQAAVTVPPAAEFISDPMNYPVAPVSDLAVTFHLDVPPARETGHPGSRATSYYVHGDAVSAPTLTDAKRVDHWYQLSEIDVEAAPGAASVVALGDSITDGHGATTNGADRQQVNQWIRAEGHFDAVIDFDAVVRDPQHPDQLLPAYDCGDHLHPSPAGYKAMGTAIPLELFAR